MVSMNRPNTLQKPCKSDNTVNVIIYACIAISHNRQRRLFIVSFFLVFFNFGWALQVGFHDKNIHLYALQQINISLFQGKSLKLLLFANIIYNVIISLAGYIIIIIPLLLLSFFIARTTKMFNLHATA